MFVYSMRDTRANEFGPLLLSANDEVMVRALRDGMPAQSIVRRYPLDFDVYCVGEFDAQRGELKPLVPTVLVVNMAMVVGMDDVAVEPQGNAPKKEEV